MSPPAFFLSCLTGMVGLALLAPGQELLAAPLRTLGLVPVSLGVAMHRAGTSRFLEVRTTVEPTGVPAVLVQDGVFAWTRNPMYVGGAVILVGVSGLLGAATPTLVLPVYVTFVGRHFIRTEENVLVGRFGEAYHSYCRRVRRWL